MRWGEVRWDSDEMELRLGAVSCCETDADYRSVEFTDVALSAGGVACPAPLGTKRGANHHATPGPRTNFLPEHTSKRPLVSTVYTKG